VNTKLARRAVLAVFCLLFLQTGLLNATQTENNVLHILPSLGPVNVDGKFDDWDLSGGLFACDDVERFRNEFSVSFYAMYDKENLYLLARIKDQTPLNNDQSSKGGYGFVGDCLQVRFITAYKTPEEKVSHWMCWRDRDEINVLSAQCGRDFKGLTIDNALNEGAKQAFIIDADGKGYAQEISIPWKLLTPNGQPLAASDTMRMAIEPNYTAGSGGRLTTKDIFRAGIVPDRVFTFRAYENWGEAVLEKSGKMPMPAIRLSDEREFPAKVVDGYVVSEWAGLIQKKELPGFKAISFDVPADGYVSLNIKNAQGEVVRQLLNEAFYEKGKQEVKWDGLKTPRYKTPTEVVDVGAYTWEAISHPAFKVTFRGWAGAAGSHPWNNGPTTDWGGDHGMPDSVVTDGSRIYLGWSFAEGGRPILGCDLDGNMLWRVGTGIDSAEHLAVDGKTLFSLGTEDGSCRKITRLRSKDGVYDNWEGRTSASFVVNDLWADKADKNLWPRRANGMDAKNGKIYLTFSDQSFYVNDVIDWKGLVVKLTSEYALGKRIFAKVDPRTTQRLKDFVAGKQKQEEAFRTWAGGPQFDREVLRELNDLLKATDLVPGSDKMAPTASTEANRKALEKAFAPCIQERKTNFIAVCDGATGKLIKTMDAKYPQAVHVTNDGQLAFVSDGSAIMILNPESGEVKQFITGLSEVTNFTFDSEGKCYVTVSGDDQQVKIFGADGKMTGSIGKKGGRQLLGKWQDDGMRNPVSAVVDQAGKRLWVAESDFFPKRISVWNLADGKFVKDFFGPTHYGASGGAINPLDPNMMIGVGCEWKLNPETGRSICVGVFERSTHGFAAFCPGSNGKLYVSVITNFGVDHGPAGLRVFERIGEGAYKLRSEWKISHANQTTTIWSDANDNEKQDADEVKTLPYTVMLAGANQWSMNMNPADLTIYGGVLNENGAKWNAGTAQKMDSRAVKLAQKEFAKVYRINPAGFTACGAPKWDLENMKELAGVWSENLQNTGFGMLPSKDNKYLLTCGSDFKCFDLMNGKSPWSYPNTFSNVHGSHAAPPPVPGLMRGAFGMIGTFKTPETGNTWAINGNCGEWYLLNEEGYFLSHLFQGDPLKVHFPEKAVPGADMTECPCGGGGEDFGGSLVQGTDGKVYAEAGAHAYWNLLVSGFDKVAKIGNGKLEIKPEEIALAKAQQEAQMQVAIGTRQTDVKKLSTTLTGNLGKDFPGVQQVNFQKNAESAVRAVVAWDDKNLYLGWDVTDNTPWVNGATEFPQMYVCGDTVDFQFGSDSKANAKRGEAAAGDFRISIGNFQGKPTAVLYRPISATKKPKSFSSGLVAKYEMDFVDILADAQVQTNIRPDKKGYIVEAAIPWSALGFTPEVGVKYHGDLGATHGNTDSRTSLRTYWSNQETGLVNDVVYELRMVPKNWGDFVFQK